METKKYQISNENNLCISCYHAITNPVCERCYLRQIEKWLDQIGLKQNKKQKILQNLHTKLSNETTNEEKCILCGDEAITTCSYCFFLKAAKGMKKAGMSGEFIQSFLAIFNYHQDEYPL